jgi:hypothetical protein
MSGAKKKGCQIKPVSEPVNNNDRRSARKQPSDAIVDGVWPVGSDSTKKAKAADFLVAKVTKAIAKSTQQSR